MQAGDTGILIVMINCIGQGNPIRWATRAREELYFYRQRTALEQNLVAHRQTGEGIDPQNMLHMGGLRKKMPTTFWTFLIGGLSLSGFPLITAGFFSKDAILEGALGGGYILGFIALALAAHGATDEFCAMWQAGGHEMLDDTEFDYGNRWEGTR